MLGSPEYHIARAIGSLGNKKGKISILKRPEKEACVDENVGL